MSRAASVAGYMRKAERALDETRLILGTKTEKACSRAYYAYAIHRSHRIRNGRRAALFAAKRGRCRVAPDGVQLTVNWIDADLR